MKSDEQMVAAWQPGDQRHQTGQILLPAANSPPHKSSPQVILQSIAQNVVGCHSVAPGSSIPLAQDHAVTAPLAEYIEAFQQQDSGILPTSNVATPTWFVLCKVSELLSVPVTGFCNQ